MKNVTNSFNVFMTESPDTSGAYMNMVRKQSQESALETALDSYDES